MRSLIRLLATALVALAATTATPNAVLDAGTLAGTPGSGTLAGTPGLATLPQLPAPPDTTTARVVILGTGTPNADPDRWGPAVAVVAGGRAYLVDAGAGVVRRAAAAARNHEIAALAPEGLDRLFVTHLHLSLIHI